MKLFSLVLLLASLVGAASFTVAPRAGAMRTLPKARSCPPVAAIDPDLLTSSTTDLLAALPGLSGYGGSSAFSQNANSGTGGDLFTVAALSVIFPTAVTLFFFNPFKRD